MHNQEDKDNFSMMWPMMICCLLPLIFLVPSANKWLSQWYLWPIIIIGFVVVHLWMHGKHHHSGNDNNNTEDKTKPEYKEDSKKDKSDRSHNGQCH